MRRVNKKHHARSPFDRLLFRLVTIGWQDERVSRYPEQVKRYSSSLPVEFTGAFLLIDGKAAGLLTHVSLMIAGLGLVAPLVADNHFEIGVVVAEIAVYLLIAVGCLRCLALFNSIALSEGGPDLIKVARHELIIRRELYALCNRGAIIFTIIVFLLLPVLYFYQPERHV